MSNFARYKTRSLFMRDYDSGVRSVNYSPTDKTQVTLDNNKTGYGVCLGCANAPCVKKTEDEIVIGDIFKDFPGCQSLDVCPTHAISRKDETGFFSVDNNNCIGCGLCVARCPYGAISLLDNGIASVAIDDKDSLTINKIRERPHPKPKKNGAMIAEKEIPSAIQNPDALSDAGSNSFVRNLMQEIGMKCETRRPGDTNFRMDMLGGMSDGRLFIAEIELSNAELESPRKLLEDMAIMHARYKIPIKDIEVISVVLQLPNKRSEYYQVMDDIQRVLGIKCRTLTVGALLTIFWSGKTLDGFTDDGFVVKSNNESIVKSLEELGVNFAEPYPGAFKAVK